LSGFSPTIQPPSIANSISEWTGSERVGSRLRREAVALEGCHEAADVLTGDVADRHRPEVVDDVDPQPVGVRSIVDGLRPAARLAAISASPTWGSGRRRCSAARFPPARVRRRPRSPAVRGACRVPPRLPLLGVGEPEPAVDLPATVAPLRKPCIAVGSGAPVERASAVPGAAMRARHCCSLCVL
jgi:hypothetical protein